MRAQTVSDSGNFEIVVDVGFKFKKLIWSGRLFSSGGTGSPIVDFPKTNKRSSGYTSDNVGNGCAGTGEPQHVFNKEEVTFNDANYFAAWYVWSDHGNVCGGTGAWIELTYVAIELEPIQ